MYFFRLPFYVLLFCHIHLSNNQISDITPLENLTKLNRLFLDSNNIKDIAPLIKIGELEMLILDNNPIQDYSPLDQMKVEYLYK